MFSNHKAMLVALIIAFTFSTVGCTTQYRRGDGVIVAVKKVRNKDYKPHQMTYAGAQVGGTVGAIGGAAAGGFVGMAVGAFAYGSIPVLVASTLGGAALGALIVGGAGAAMGGGFGYAADVIDPHSALYQFTVKPDDCQQPITITQYSQPLAVNSEVHIIEKNNHLLITPR